MRLYVPTFLLQRIMAEVAAAVLAAAKEEDIKYAAILVEKPIRKQLSFIK